MTVDKGTAAFLRRAQGVGFIANHVDRKHGLDLMRRGLLEPGDDRGFKTYRFVLTKDGRAALAAYDAEARAHNGRANDARWITIALQDADVYCAAQTGERRVVCERVVRDLRTLEVPFRN